MIRAYMINVRHPSLISVETEKGIESYILPNTLDLMSVSEKINEKNNSISYCQLWPFSYLPMSGKVIYWLKNIWQYHQKSVKKFETFLCICFKKCTLAIVFLKIIPRRWIYDLKNLSKYQAKNQLFYETTSSDDKKKITGCYFP